MAIVSAKLARMDEIAFEPARIFLDFNVGAHQSIRSRINTGDSVLIRLKRREKRNQVFCIDSKRVEFLIVKANH